MYANGWDSFVVPPRNGVIARLRYETEAIFIRNFNLDIALVSRQNNFETLLIERNDLAFQ